MANHGATVERPIFIIGTGRSGTTLFFDILSNHPSLAWPCQYMVGERLRGTERLVNKLAALPGLRGVFGNHRYRRRPVPEPYPFWRRHSPGFARPVRDLDARDVHPAARRDVYAAFAQQLEAMRRPRFLTKYTGWSRIRFIDAIFPDALAGHYSLPHSRRHYFAVNPGAFHLREMVPHWARRLRRRIIAEG